MKKFTAVLTVLFFAALCCIASAQEEMWLKFNEGKGNVAKDSTGNGHDGELVDFKGDPWVEGKFEKALMFEGGSERVVVPVFDALDAETFTIEAWIYPTELPKGLIHDAKKNNQ